jgi:multiple sugar transport system substrate-binding protein
VKKFQILILLLATLALALGVAACGGDDDEGDTGGGGAEQGSSEGAKSVDAAAMENAKGEVTYCSGKDTSGDLKESIKEFNDQGNGVTVTLTEFPEDAQQQHDQFTRRQRAKSADCDGFEEDVVWTAEFVSQKWLLDMTPYMESRQDEFIESTLKSVTYDDKMWGVPRVTDAGLLFYRTDQVKEVPATWQEVYDVASQNDGIVYQGAAYEGLTVDFLELGYAAGGTPLNEDGSESTINSPENLKALQFMVDGIKNGAAPKAVTTMQEEPARRAWEAGKATFMRNWPYCYALSKAAPKVKDKFEVAPYPEFEGGQKSAILGGHNMVISAFSDNPGAILKFIDYATSQERLTKNATKYSKAPTMGAVYEDAAVKKALPFAPELQAAVEQAEVRPVSPVYPQISEAIFKNVNAALSGQMSPEEALEQAESDMNEALQTF